MRLISTRFIAPGMVTGAPVFGSADRNGTPLVSAAVPISDAICRRLRTSDVPRMYIDDRMSAGIDPPRILEYNARRAIMDAVRACEEHLDRETTPLNPRHILSLERSAATIVEELYEHLTTVVCLNDQLLHGVDPEAIAVSRAVVGGAIARDYFNTNGWTDYRGTTRNDRVPERVGKLVIGLLLADIGLRRVPKDARATAGIMETSAVKEYQRHPSHGLRMLTGSNISPLSRVVVSQHHERHDGTGFPRRLAGSNINVNARIAAVAHAVIDACTGTMAGGNRTAEHLAWHEIRAGAGTAFDPDVIAAFSRTIAPYAPGTCVVLNDGRSGIVQQLDPGDVHLPTVRVTHDGDGKQLAEPFATVDLASTVGVHIAASLECLPTELNHAA
jgi:hypothetical protein